MTEGMTGGLKHGVDRNQASSPQYAMINGLHPCIALRDDSPDENKDEALTIAICHGQENEYGVQCYLRRHDT